MKILIFFFIAAVVVLLNSYGGFSAVGAINPTESYKALFSNYEALSLSYKNLFSSYKTLSSSYEALLSSYTAKENCWPAQIGDTIYYKDGSYSYFDGCNTIKCNAEGFCSSTLLHCPRTPKVRFGEDR